jgi:hypothetical protein
MTSNEQQQGEQAAPEEAAGQGDGGPAGQEPAKKHGDPLLAEAEGDAGTDVPDAR